MNQMTFKNRAEFRAWLAENALSEEGVWLVFSKQVPPSTIKAGEALEEALCFGWIDGQMKSVDEASYIKYFKQRKNDSNWSEKNKKLVDTLEQANLMTDYGRAKIDYAKQHGNWMASALRPSLTEEQLLAFEGMVLPYEKASVNFLKMTPSVCKAYASSYFFGAKTEDGKQKRFDTIIERLELNLNPMESMKKKP